MSKSGDEDNLKSRGRGTRLQWRLIRSSLEQSSLTPVLYSSASAAFRCISPPTHQDQTNSLLPDLCRAE